MSWQTDNQSEQFLFHHRLHHLALSFTTLRRFLKLSRLCFNQIDLIKPKQFWWIQLFWLNIYYYEKYLFESFFFILIYAVRYSLSFLTDMLTKLILTSNQCLSKQPHLTQQLLARAGKTFFPNPPIYPTNPPTPASSSYAAQYTTHDYKYVESSHNSHDTYGLNSWQI